MQTFLPYMSFLESARALDDKRLGKQRVETMQIMKALLTGKGWIHHPATKMWRGHEQALLNYQMSVCHIWKTERGFKDTCYEKTLAMFKEHRKLERRTIYPEWLGDARFHLAHQSNLIRKNPDHYRPLFGATVPDDLPYLWPSPMKIEELV